MNKKLITSLLTFTLLSSAAAVYAQPAVAQTKPAVAILDTGIDTSLPAFQGRIIQEVCILDWTTCPNGKNFMEGSGAASMPSNLITLNGFDHGTFMTSVLLQSNPNVDVVFIKVIGNTPTGSRQTAFESTVFNALNWVNTNAAKYNIQAVTMAQGHHNLGAAGTDYCPKTPNTKASVEALAANNIPVFFPAGNGRDYARIDWPSCLDASQSVGYTDQNNEIASNSNNDNAKVDFFARGYFTVPGPGNVSKNIAGSSAAIQVAAAQYIALKSAKPALSMNQLIDILKSTSKNTVGRQGTIKKLISLADAMSSSVVAPVVPAAPQIDAQAVAKAALKAEVDKAIAAAETQYQIELKAAQDKLAATKATWLAKLNG
jgi:hypothetical protein